MTVAILQPSYIPWRGYFHQVQKADLFVFYDCVQYDRNGWRNRNRIKTNQGSKWLTIPVFARGHISRNAAILEIPIDWGRPWTMKHRKTLQRNYARAPFFSKSESLLDEIFDRRDEKLVDFTCFTTELIARSLGISKTRFLRSSSLPATGFKTDRLLSILEHLGADHYISGPSAQSYIETEKFDAAGISVEFMSYEYSEYPQINGAFDPSVSILDLIFNTGADAPLHIWG